MQPISFQAANWGSDECVQLLLSQSADPNALDRLWRTPLMLAAAHAHTADTVLRRLVSAGSDVNAVGGPERRTALHYAASRGLNPEVLLEAGADPRLRDSIGNTALHVAAAAGHSHVVKVLIQCEHCNPNATNDNGQTALHVGAASGDVACLSAIVDSSAGVSACFAADSSGHLPVWYAAVNGHYSASVFFIRLNAISPTSSATANPLNAALDKCHVTIARALLIGGCESRTLVFDWLVGVRERSSAWLEDHVEDVDWLEQFAHAPCELGHLCRLSIRRALGSRLQDSVDKLMLPKKLQQFIMMDDLIV